MKTRGYDWLFVMSVASCACVAADATTAPLDDATLLTILKAHFGEARPAGSEGGPVPRYAVADLDGDGKEDLVIPYSDAETPKRGNGCYGLGIVGSYREARDRQSAFHLYDCFRKYTVENPQNASIKSGGQAINLKRPSQCVQITLTYGRRNLLCWINGGYRTEQNGTRTASPAPVAARAPDRPADDPLVPPEFLGTWATTQASCAQNGRGALRISKTGLELNGARGRINAVTTTGLRKLEILFEEVSGKPDAQQVRTYTLSADGRTLWETRFGEKMATRTRCEVSQQP